MVISKHTGAKPGAPLWVLPRPLGLPFFGLPAPPKGHCSCGQQRWVPGALALAQPRGPVAHSALRASSGSFLWGSGLGTNLPLQGFSAASPASKAPPPRGPQESGRCLVPVSACTPGKCTPPETLVVALGHTPSCWHCGELRTDVGGT